jgi:hypothetical protein
LIRLWFWIAVLNLITPFVLIGQEGPPTRYFRRYHSESDIFVSAVCQTRDDGVALTGSIGEEFGNVRLLLVDSAGTAYATGTYHRTGFSVQPINITLAGDGGFVIGCLAVQLDGSEQHSLWIVKTNSNGDTVWSCPLRPNLLASTYHVGLLAPASTESTYVFIETADEFNYRYTHRVTISAFGDSLRSDSLNWFEYGSIYGAMESGGAVTTWGKTVISLRVSRLTDDFESVWTGGVQFWPIYGDFFFPNAQVTLNGQVAISGEMVDDSLGATEALFLVHEDGDSLWLYLHEWSMGTRVFTDVVEGPDDNLVCAGYTCCESPPYLVKVGLDGHEMWTQEYGDSLNHEKAVGIFTNRDGSYTIAGWTSPNNMRRIRPFVLRTEPDGLASKEIPSLPRDFSLSQNFPNPFNPTTEIVFSLPAETEATLRVFDVLGREVALLVDRRMSAGEQRTLFDGTLLAAGVYFYRLEAPGFVLTRKMLLLK